nr:MAG TPA: hypothetical protein [Caudoviricetes sp.]
MQTSQKPISPHGGGESTFFQEGSLANLSALPDNERERAMTVTSGLKCYGLYGRYSPLGSLARTLLASSRWYSPARRLKWEAKPLFSERLTEKEYCCVKSTSSRPSAETLEVKDIPSNRFLFRLVPSEHRTGGTGSGLWQDLLPTPRAVEIVEHPMKQAARLKDRTGMKLNNLSSGAAFGLLPTPMATEVRHEKRVMELKHAGGNTFHSRKNGETRPNGLTDCMDFHGLLPTPTASDKEMGTAKDRKDGKSRMGELKHFVAHQRGQTSQLNPLFVAEMMGFPVDWTVSPFQSGGRNPSKPTETR